MSGVVNELAYAGIGLAGTRLVVGTVLTTVGATNTVTAAAAKIATAYGVAWIVTRFMGGGHFNALFLGGAIDGVNDLLKSFVGPYVPALAMYGDTRSVPMVMNGYPREDAIL